MERHFLAGCAFQELYCLTAVFMLLLPLLLLALRQV
jgi:hypothetical protein